METEDAQRPTQEPDQLGGGDFVADGVHVKLTLTSNGVAWTTPEDHKSVDVEWRDVIRCHRGKVSARKPMDVQEGADKEPCFTVHYIDKQKDHVWKHKYITFHSSDGNFEDILSLLCEKSKEDHPGRLMVLINPVGGTGKGQAQYSRVIAPLFNLAQIDTDVIVSQHPKHPHEIGETYDFSKVDGVVIVGGDGTYQQLLHTWLPRLQREAGIDISDPDKNLNPLTCPVGMIPTGTGNGLARGNYGCFDLATAALNIISGRRTKKNLLIIQSGNQHFAVSGVILASGYWCDLLDTALDARWLGWLRYPIGMIIAVFKRRREFYVQVEYLPCNRNTEGSKTDQSSPEADWVSVEGYYTGVFCIPSVLTPNEDTGKCKAKPNSESVTLALEKQCGKMKYFRWMYKIIQFSNDMMDADFITPVEVKAYRYRIIQKEGESKSDGELSLEKNINVDGEVLRLEHTDISVRNRQDMMEMFGTDTM